MKRVKEGRMWDISNVCFGACKVIRINGAQVRMISAKRCRTHMHEEMEFNIEKTNRCMKHNQTFFLPFFISPDEQTLSFLDKFARAYR